MGIEEIYQSKIRNFLMGKCDVIQLVEAMLQKRIADPLDISDYVYRRFDGDSDPKEAYCDGRIECAEDYREVFDFFLMADTLYFKGEEYFKKTYWQEDLNKVKAIVCSMPEYAPWPFRITFYIAASKAIEHYKKEKGEKANILAKEGRDNVISYYPETDWDIVRYYSEEHEAKHADWPNASSRFFFAIEQAIKYYKELKAGQGKGESNDQAGNRR